MAHNQLIKMTPTSDREWLIQVDGKVDRMCEAVERLAEAVEKLETIKFQNHEVRLSKIEKWQSEWSGAYRVVTILALVLASVATIKSFIK